MAAHTVLINTDRIDIRLIQRFVIQTCVAALLFLEDSASLATEVVGTLRGRLSMSNTGAPFFAVPIGTPVATSVVATICLLTHGPIFVILGIGSQVAGIQDARPIYNPPCVLDRGDQSRAFTINQCGDNEDATRRS